MFQRNQGGAGNWGQVKKLAASDAQPGDKFGVSAAVNGDTILVGAFYEDGGVGNPLPDAGAAYVFQRNQGGTDNWGQVKKLTASDAQASTNFGWRVAVSGDTVIVGAADTVSLGTPTDGAYVFQRDQGGADNWGEVTKLVILNPQTGEAFGSSVAISGDTAVVGADRKGNNAGAAYVFQRNQGGAGNWGQVKKLTGSDSGDTDRFGASVAISGDTTVVGSAGEDWLGDDVGAAYVFQRDEGGADNWGEVKRLTASDAQVNDAFGGSVSISGNTVVVEAWREDGGAGNPSPDAGAAYVFQRDEGGTDNWGEVNRLAASDAQTGDNFSWSVAISGNTVLAGAPGEDAGGLDAGAAYVFHALKQPDPGDTDGDGCSDQRENGPDEVESQSGNFNLDFPADSFFDVFVEVDLPGLFSFPGGTLYNSDPLLVTNYNVTSLPPRVVYVHGNSSAVPVYFRSDNLPEWSAGDLFGWLTLAGHGASFDDSPADIAEFAQIYEDVVESAPLPMPDSDSGGAPDDLEIAEGGDLGSSADDAAILALDSDADGCASGRELGTDEAMGGQRDPLNPWDYYDVIGPFGSLTLDGVIDLPNDILGVILHFSPQGQPPYDVRFDRGPSVGVNHWQRDVPDGVIDLPNDILGVILQHNHNCV